MSTVLMLMICVPLVAVVGQFWGRLLRRGVLRLIDVVIERRSQFGRPAPTIQPFEPPFRPEDR